MERVYIKYIYIYNIKTINFKHDDLRFPSIVVNKAKGRISKWV